MKPPFPKAWRRLGALLLGFGTILRAETAAPTAFPLVAANGDRLYHPLDRGSRPIRIGPVPVEVPSNFVAVPGGSSVLGTGRDSVRTNLPTFLISRFPVTEAEYHAFAEAVGLGPRPRHWINGRFPDGRDLHPVPFVSFQDAERYCAWVSSKTGLRVRLPSTAEWEKAARGPEGFLYPRGNEAGVRFRNGRLETRFNYNGVVAVRHLRELAALPAGYTKAGPPYSGWVTNVGRIAAYRSDGTPSFLAVSPTGNVSGWVDHRTRTGFMHTDVFSALSASGGATSPVGAYPDGVSGYGAHDMAGNLRNWTATRITARNGAEKGKTVNEIRGGSWYATLHSCRSVGIGEGRDPSGRHNTVGFRLVIDP